MVAEEIEIVDEDDRQNTHKAYIHIIYIGYNS